MIQLGRNKSVFQITLEDEQRKNIRGINLDSDQEEQKHFNTAFDYFVLYTLSNKTYERHIVYEKY